MKNNFSGLLVLATFALVAPIKLPYVAGQKFIAVQAYDAPPTHIKKDLYAIDFSQNECDAYGKLAVAASSGKVMLAQEGGYNGGYGTQVLLVDGLNSAGDSSAGGHHIVARYAHLIPGTIPVMQGETVARGQPLGEIGNTGLVAGAACPTHPGTHIHFAMYDGPAADDSYAPVLPEPISGYTDITAGKWYLSDNAIASATIGVAVQTATGGLALVAPVPVEQSAIISTGTAIIQQAAPSSSENSGGQVLGATTSTSAGNGFGVGTSSGGMSGGVSVSPSESGQDTSLAPVAEVIPTTSTTSTEPAASTTPEVATTSVATIATTTMASATFNSSTLAIDLVWQAPTGTAATGTAAIYLAASSTPILIATTTAASFSYPIAAADFGTTLQFVIAGDESTISTVSVSLPDWWTMIQPADQEGSSGSWYSDNWYNLGTGFYGTIRSLVLEGFVDGSEYFKSDLWLDEYLDENYSQLNQSWTISNDAPFTNSLRKVTIDDLNIALQPNKYYRLRTNQHDQNHSVILAGTSATGTAMYNEYIFNVGRVEYQYPFYPYLAAIMIPNYPPLAPPGPPAGMAISFDSMNSSINISWQAAADPDTLSNLLTYQVNVGTSTTLDDTMWRPMGRSFSAGAAVAYNNSYKVGVRAIDDLGNIGLPITEVWHFPAAYVPVPQQLDHSAVLHGDSAQKITFAATTTVGAIALWTKPELADWSCCSQSFVSLRADDNGTPGMEIASTSPVTVGRFGIDAERAYSFPAPAILSPGTYWFALQGGPWSPTNGTYIFGSASDTYSGGEWSGSPGQDAYFRIGQAVGP